MIATLKNFARDESGATAIEYGLIAALVSVACIAALRGMGTTLSSLFNTVSAELNTAITSTATGG